MLIRCAMIALLLCTIPLSHADLIGEYALDDDQRLVLSYRDDNHIRVELGGSDLLLISQGRTLLVTQRGGQPMAVDLDQMGPLLGILGQKASTVDIPKAGTVQMAATGKSETVAGYRGEWYLISEGDRQYRALLSSAPDVVALTRAMGQVAGRLSQLLGPQQAGDLQQLMAEALRHDPGGVLRAEQLRLLTVTEEERPDTHYRLPAGTTLMGLPGLSR